MQKKTLTGSSALLFVPPLPLPLPFPAAFLRLPPPPATSA